MAKVMTGKKLLLVLTGVLLIGQPAYPPLLVADMSADGSVQVLREGVKNEGQGVEGTAAYYARRYHGKRTHSGNRHDASGMTAAHPELPIGSRVRVVNLANGKEVIVVINDRCRSRKKPFIDLSRAAAQKLGFLGKGTARVLIIPLGREPS